MRLTQDGNLMGGSGIIEGMITIGKTECARVAWGVQDRRAYTWAVPVEELSVVETAEEHALRKARQADMVVG